MENNEKKILHDILVCINNINQYLGSEKNFDKYANNLMLQDAIERNLITIGEAVSRILRINPTIVLTNARRIVDARNKLTHGYDEIENVQVWSIIIKHLPILAQEIKLLLPK
jgi:uncharacterized protein with HEPN domain